MERIECNFVYCTGGSSPSKFLEQVGRNAAEEAVDAFLQYIGLSNKVSVNEICDEQAITANQGGKYEVW